MRKTRRQHGGTLILDIRQILLTKPILNILESKVDVSGYSKQKGFQGFPLKRMNTLKNNINSLEPIVVKETKYGKSIDGEKKRLYEIIDGRHRLTKAILQGKKTVRVTIYSNDDNSGGYVLLHNKSAH